MNGSNLYEDLLKQRFQTLRILWIMMTVSIAIYCVVGIIVSMNGDASGDIGGLRLGLDAVAVSSALGSVVFKMVAFSRDRLAERLKQPVNLEAQATRRDTGAVDGEQLEKLESLSDPERKVYGLIGWYQFRFVILLALHESIAIYGLILTIVTHQVEEMLPFAAVALFLNIRLFSHPRLVVEECESLVSPQ